MINFRNSEKIPYVEATNPVVDTCESRMHQFPAGVQSV